MSEQLVSPRLNISLDELYLLLGERLVVQYKLEQQIKHLLEQADQMAQEITKLRSELVNLTSDTKKENG